MGRAGSDVGTASICSMAHHGNSGIKQSYSLIHHPTPTPTTGALLEPCPQMLTAPCRFCSRILRWRLCVARHRHSASQEAAALWQKARSRSNRRPGNMTVPSPFSNNHCTNWFRQLHSDSICVPPDSSPVNNQSYWVLNVGMCIWADRLGFAEVGQQLLNDYCMLQRVMWGEHASIRTRFGEPSAHFQPLEEFI